MSIYYELRMSGTLSFKDKKDDLSLKIKNFFKSLLTIEEKIRYKSSLDLDKDYILKYNTIENKYYGVINNWCPNTYHFKLENDFVYESDNEYLLVKINEIEIDVFEVDYCLGNKNGFSVLELITLLLMEYMEDDFKLVYYDEASTKKLKVTKDSLSNYIKENTVDENFGCTIFDTLVVESHSILDTIDEEEYEKNWLRAGLFFNIEKDKGE